MDITPLEIIDSYVIAMRSQQALRLTAITKMLYFVGNENVHRRGRKIT